MKIRKKEPAADIPVAMPFLMDGVKQNFDPFGSYTGVPADPDEKPIQDADDL